MIVLVAGMPRSGSTFSFNVVREVLRARGTVHQEACDDLLGALHRSSGADHVLVKAHSFDVQTLELVRAGAVRTIVTLRRVEDAMASWFEAFDELPEESSIQIMRDWLHQFPQLRPQACTIAYEQIDRRPWLATWRIARAVCPRVGPAEVTRIARRFSKSEVKRQVRTITRGGLGITDIGFSQFDDATFFHRRHVSQMQSRSAEQRLPAERLARVRKALENDIISAGLCGSYEPR